MAESATLHWHTPHCVEGKLLVLVYASVLPLFRHDDSTHSVCSINADYPELGKISHLLQQEHI
jgi:hypothetical protein